MKLQCDRQLKDKEGIEGNASALGFLFLQHNWKMRGRTKVGGSGWRSDTVSALQRMLFALYILLAIFGAFQRFFYDFLNKNTVKNSPT